jgi:hypothetical protein
VCASWGCATTGSTDGAETGRTLTRGKPTSGYQVREAAEATDTDGLQISLERGVISQDAAQQAIMARWKELTSCYGEAGAAMSFAGGPVTLRFLVDGQGATTEVRVTDTQLGSYEVERCLVAVGRTIRFPHPQGNATAQVDYTLEFRSTGAIGVMDLSPAELDPQLPTLHARLAAACEQLGADEVSATLYIDAAGAVRSIGLASSAPFDDQAAACVAGAIRRWNARLAAVQGGVGRVIIPLRSADLLASRDRAPTLKRYSRATAPPRGRARRGRR